MRPSASASAFAFACALACGGGPPPALRVVVAGPENGPVPTEALDVLQERATALGAVVFERQPDGSVRIGFPAGSDPSRSLVRRESFSLWTVDETVPQALTEEEARQSAGGRPVVANVSGQGEPWLVLTPPPVVSAADVSEADVRVDDATGEPSVTVTLDDDGAKRFGDATASAVGKRIAIVTADGCVSAPLVREPIVGGKVWITLGAAGKPADQLLQEARDLAAVLDAGELPVALEIREVSTW